MGEDRAEEFGARNGVEGELLCRMRSTCVSGIIAMSGEFTGTVVLSMPGDTAVSIVTVTMDVAASTQILGSGTGHLLSVPSLSTQARTRCPPPCAARPVRSWGWAAAGWSAAASRSRSAQR